MTPCPFSLDDLDHEATTFPGYVDRGDDLSRLLARLHDAWRNGDDNAAVTASALLAYARALRLEAVALDEARREQDRIREAYGAARWTCHNYVYMPGLTDAERDEAAQLFNDEVE